MKYVLDTSVVAKLYLREEGRVEAEKLIISAIQQKVELLAPSLILFELNNTLIINGLDTENLKKSIGGFMDFVKSGVIEIVETNLDLLVETQKIACMDTGGHGHISSFDATFHALAIRENAVFITADEKHVRKTKDLIGGVEKLADVKI